MIYRTNRPPSPYSEEPEEQKSFKERHPKMFSFAKFGATIAFIPVIFGLLYVAGWILFPGVHHLGLFFCNTFTDWTFPQAADHNIIPWLVGVVLILMIVCTFYISRWIIRGLFK